MSAAAKRAKEKPVPKKNPGKHKSTAEEDDDQARGLWVNTEFFRNLTRRAPQTVVHPTTTEEQNYYLKLAEIILGPTEKRKIDRIETAFQKSPAQSKKRKVR